MGLPPADQSGNPLPLAACHPLDKTSNIPQKQ